MGATRSSPRGPDPSPVALVAELSAPEEPADDEALHRAEAAVRHARALFSELGEAPALVGSLELGEDLEAASWRLCALAPLNPYDSQRLLEIDSPVARLEHLNELSTSLAEDLTRLLGEAGEVGETGE
jgi:Lon protease-like protein